MSSEGPLAGPTLETDLLALRGTRGAVIVMTYRGDW